MTHNAKEREDRPCVNGWSDCTCCAYEIECRMGRYTGEKPIIEIAAEICEKKMQEETVKSVEKIKERRGCKAYTNLEKFYAWKSPSLHHKDAVLVGGPPAKGGGSKSKGAKKPIKKKPEYMKYLGM